MKVEEVITKAAEMMAARAGDKKNSMKDRDLWNDKSYKKGSAPVKFA